MPRIILLIRRSREYYLEKTLQLPNMEVDNNTDFWKEYHAKSKRAIQWWNQLFNTPYTTFKQNLANIATQYHNNYGTTIHHLDYRHINTLTHLPNTWIYPTDEDDWPHPELPKILRNINPNNYDYTIWDVHRICVLGHQCVLADLDYYDKNIIISNSYAVTPRERQAHIAYHGRLDHILRREDKRTKYIKRPLGLKVDNPSSLSLLVRCETKQMLETITRQFQQHINNIKTPKVFQKGYNEFKQEILKL